MSNDFDDNYGDWLHESLPELADNYYNGRHLQPTPVNDPDTMYDTQPDFREFCKQEWQEQCDSYQDKETDRQEDLLNK